MRAMSLIELPLAFLSSPASQFISRFTRACTRPINARPNRCQLSSTRITPVLVGSHASKSSSKSYDGPTTPTPDYTTIDNNVFNKLFTNIFLRKLENELGTRADDGVTGYDAVIQVVRRLADRYRGDPHGLRMASQRVLASLFPAWLPPAFVVLFSKPAPAFANWINAAITVAVTQWLMGPSSLSSKDSNTVEIERCRYLEQTGCVGICVNSCKSATETFFETHMGIPLAIEPNTEDFSCKFKFGQTPVPIDNDDMYKHPCLSQCTLKTKSTDNPCHAVKLAAKLFDKQPDKADH